MALSYRRGYQMRTNLMLWSLPQDTVYSGMWEGPLKWHLDQLTPEVRA